MRSSDKGASTDGTKNGVWEMGSFVRSRGKKGRTKRVFQTLCDLKWLVQDGGLSRCFYSTLNFIERQQWYLDTRFNL